MDLLRQKAPGARRRSAALTCPDRSGLGDLETSGEGRAELGAHRVSEGSFGKAAPADNAGTALHMRESASPKRATSGNGPAKRSVSAE